MKYSFFKKISSYVFSKDNASNITCSFLCSVMNIITNLGIPYLINEAISALSTKQDLKVFDEFTLSPIQIISLYAAALSLSKILYNTQKITVTKMSVRSGKKLTMHYLNKLIRLPMNDYLTTKDGRKLELMNKAFAGMIDFTSLLLEQIAPTGVEASLAVTILYKNKNLISATGIGGILVVNIIYSLAFSKRIAKIQDDSLQLSLAANDTINEFIGNFELIHTFGTIEHEIAKINKTWSDLEMSTIKFMTISDSVGIGQQLLTGTGIAVILILTGEQVLSGQLSVENFVITAYYLIQFSVPIIRFSDAINRIRGSISSLKEIFDFLENPQHTSLNDVRLPLDIKNESFDIIFDKVTFCYREKGPYILRDFSLHIKAGKKYGIIGESGAGKSTLIHLLLGFIHLKPGMGTIKIANQDIKQINAESIRTIVGFVPQNPVLFHDTLRYNICYGTDSCIDEDIFLAVKRAGISDEIFQEKFPDNLETIVGKRGSLLSGGERQRVAIARALYRKPKIFIFDEATSSLDSNTEDEVQNNLDEISRGTTTLVISHKLSAVKNADCIVALDKGGIAEIGTHQELLMKKSTYYRLWCKQAKHFCDLKDSDPEITNKQITANNPTLPCYSNIFSEEDSIDQPAFFKKNPAAKYRLEGSSELKEPLLKDNSHSINIPTSKSNTPHKSKCIIC